MSSGSSVGRVCAALVAAAILGGCRESAERDAAGGEHDHEGTAHPAASSAVQRGDDGRVIITLEGPAQAKIGLQTAAPKAVTLPSEVKAYGRVLDPAPLVALVAELGVARTAAETSARELERVKRLFDQDQNTSRRALEAAESAAQRDRIGCEAARLKLITTWGPSVAAQPDFSAFAESLAARQIALVRLDLPAGETVADPQAARLFTLEAPEQPIRAELLGRTPDIDSQTQGQGYLFLVKTDSGGLRPGQALRGFIQQAGNPLTGLLAPPSALVRAQGRAWVYLKTGPTTFTRREISLEHPMEGGWLVAAALGVQDQLVVVGAQMLFSEESKGRQAGE